MTNNGGGAVSGRVLQQRDGRLKLAVDYAAAFSIEPAAQFVVSWLFEYFHKARNTMVASNASLFASSSLSA